MSRRWIQFHVSIALGLSLLLHGGLVIGLIVREIDRLQAMLAAGVGKADRRVQSADLIPFDRDKDDTAIGDPDGSGDAIASIDLLTLAGGRRASQNQPMLSLDPVGHGRIGDEPSMHVGPATPTAMEEVIASARAESEAVVSMGPASVIMPAALPTPRDFVGPRLPNLPIVMAAPSPAEATAPAKSVARTSADPAPRAESEIDLFTRAGSVVFTPGRMQVQFGRKCRLTRPALPLVGWHDALSGAGLRVILTLEIDAEGRVIKSTIARSSGSNEIDNPIRLESYNWWFDPGPPETPLPWVFPFAVGIR